MRQLEEKFFEIADHLGNVRVVISDVKLPQTGGEFDADVVSYHNYYPFGMLQPGRSWTSDDTYRYLFNGKESDNEVSGTGNQYDYGFRIYNPRIAKFLSVDPLTKDYPGWSPYPFAMNRPIDGFDLEGLEWVQNRYSTPEGYEVYAYRVKIKVANFSRLTDNDIKSNYMGIDDFIGPRLFEDSFRPGLLESFAERKLSMVDDELKIIVTTDVEFEFIDKTEALSLDPEVDFFMLFFDEVDSESPLVPGRAYSVENTQANSIKIGVVADMGTGRLYPPGKVYTVIVHEILHTGGVRHPWDPEEWWLDSETNKDSNIMRYNSGTDVSLRQLLKIGNTILHNEIEKEKQADNYIIPDENCIGCQDEPK